MSSQDPNAAEPDEPRVSDLLPPPDPPDPGPKRIAERRVVGWLLASRLTDRGKRRPAGNSRAFWRKIEDDDPFLPAKVAPARLREDHTLYPSDRLERVPQPWTPPAEPRPQPAPRPQPPRPAPPPAAERPAPPPPRPTPPPPRPDPPPGRPKPPPGREVPVAREPEPPAEVVQRRLPPRAPDPVVGSRTRAGRIRVHRPGAGQQQQAVLGKGGRTASEIRAEKEQARKEVGPAAPPELRGLDSVLGVFGELAAAQQQFEAEQAEKERAKREGRAYEPPPQAAAPAPAPAPRPAEPVPEAARPSPPPPRPSPPPPRPSPPPPRPSPPPPAASPPAGRSVPMPGGAAGAGMDDLFGGNPNEGRVRIGRRSRTKPTED